MKNCGQNGNLDYKKIERTTERLNKYTLNNCFGTTY